MQLKKRKNGENLKISHLNLNIFVLLKLDTIQDA